jgi:filamentous hemagglutinin family protein
MTVAYDRFNKELNMAYFQGKLILGIVACTTFLGALPTSPTVVSGTNVTFDNSTMGVLTVSSDSPTTIVEWDSFSVANGEVVVFNLPSTDSTILNRVTGAVPSAIYGYVYASPDTQGLGTVYLVNTSGISKGPVATVVTNGFLASTLDVPNGDFLAGGAMTFTDSTQQTINNNGSIVTDMSDAILLGYQVVHAGNITAYQGSASMGAGAEIVVQPANPQRLTIVQGATGSAATGVTLATGSYINAYQAEIKADGNLYTTAIDQEGRLKITGTDTEVANVIFDSTGGTTYLNAIITCQNSDGTGGTATVLGNSIELDNSATITCSGPSGGGQISIGGGLNGSGTPYNSQNTVMQVGALLFTDATTAGNGGQTVVWSDNVTAFYGSIFSRGGINSGNGGTVQVCGVNSLTNQGNIDISAVRGSNGTKLGCP